MLTIYFYAFVALTAAMLAPFLWRPASIYEYPRFMAIAFAVFILPQAYALYRGEWGGGYLEMTLLMCSLCLACCWIGYQRDAHPALLRRLEVPIDLQRFLFGGIVLVVVAWIFSLLFQSLPEEMLSSQLTGIGTVYLFFAGLIYPGFAICLYCALKQRNVIAWGASAIAGVLPVQSVIFAGRREEAALFLVTLGLCTYFIKGIKPSRIIAIAAIVGAAVIIPATAEYRGHRAEESPVEAWQALDLGETFEESLHEESVSELKNATALIAATQATGDYQLGADYWNALVFRFVPAQFVGKELKDSLMVGWVQRDFASYVERTLGFALPIGTTVTGIGDSFNQFGYFGSLFFALLGYLFKTLWAAANRPGAAVAQIIYIQSVTTAMRAVTHETVDFLPGFIYSAIFIGAIAIYARERPPIGGIVARPQVVGSSQPRP
jgi:hypothetical protein